MLTHIKHASLVACSLNSLYVLFLTIVRSFLISLAMLVRKENLISYTLIIIKKETMSTDKHLIKW